MKYVNTLNFCFLLDSSFTANSTRIFVSDSESSRLKLMGKEDRSSKSCTYSILRRGLCNSHCFAMCIAFPLTHCSCS